VQTGTTQSQNVTLSNTGGSALTVSQANATGTGFSLSGLTLPLTLNPSQTATFSVRFAPQSNGSVSGNIALTSDGSNPTVNIPLSGAGVAAGTLSANPASIAFGSVQVGSNQKQTVSITNNGGVSLTISQANVTGTGFSISGISVPLTLTPGQSTSFSVTFAPQSAGSVSGNVALVNSGSPGTVNVPLTGTGIAAGSLTANPSSLSFGSIQIGNSSTLTETLTNTGGSTVTISQANVTGSGMSINGLSLPATLTAGQSKTFNVVFNPQSAGAVSGNLAITSDASNPSLNVPLSGTGVTQGTVSANPTSLSFGNVTVGATSTLTETVTNSGGSSLTINQANVSGTGFSINGLSLPLTLSAGESKTFNVVFNPQSAGSASGNIAIVNTGSVSTVNIPLSGTGVTQGALSPNPSSLGFGSIQVGNSSTLTETL